MRENVIIMGAAGRDFHNFNVYFRDNERYNVVCFTATQIPEVFEQVMLVVPDVMPGFVHGFKGHACPIGQTRAEHKGGVLLEQFAAVVLRQLDAVVLVPQEMAR